MGALWEMELESAPKISVSAVPYVHGGSGLMMSCACLRHTRKNIWQSPDGERQTPRELVKESIFSSKTPEERVCSGDTERETEGSNMCHDDGCDRKTHKIHRNMRKQRAQPLISATCDSALHPLTYTHM